MSTREAEAEWGKVMVPAGKIVRDVVLPRPEQVFQRSISLFVMAKNAASCIGRLLANVGPYVDEVVVVLNDTTDDTRAIVEGYCCENSKECIIEEVTAESHPDFYILDTRATYEVGQSLSGEGFDGPFTERPILAKWSHARNVGWKKCTKRWRFFLDADDIVLDPESIPGVCQALDEAGAEQGNTRYFFDVDLLGRPKGSSFRERFARNLPHLVWIYNIHEVIAGVTKVAHIDGNCIVRDLRDSKGKDIRIPGRNFKVLYQLARSNDWEVSARTIVNLLMEVRHMVDGGPSMFEFAEALLKLYLTRSTWPEERSWACCILAEMFERVGNNDTAMKLYKQSLDEHPSAKSAFLLSRVYFNLGRWQDCIDSYLLGVDHSQVHQVLNDGPLYQDMTKILVAAAYHELGLNRDALTVVDEALLAFPTSLPLASLKEKVVSSLNQPG